LLSKIQWEFVRLAGMCLLILNLQFLHDIWALRMMWQVGG
jgi:hypothetical protein